MPSSIENRVVQMTFDNVAFEKKLNETIQSIDKLEKSLEFEKSKKGLQELANTTNRFNLGDLSTHIEGVSKKFLALSTIAITTLANITNAAIHAGANIVKSLSLDLVLSGFKEYETNINSIQTILANTSAKGTGLDDVTKALDELNDFSDKTIYNFGQMTRNIGTFTAAGVDLDTSVKSIKGIANLAAISGSSAEQAASAMYQLSQAISTGTLKLIDWNSVVNAGLGGEVFQTALFETGKALKTIKNVPMDMTFEQWTKAGNSFRGSLEDGWVTAEVLTNTLQGFTGDLTEAQILAMGFTKKQAQEIQRLGKLGVDSATKVRTLTQLLSTVKESIGSGWSQSFRIIFGDFEEATALFTSISDAIGGLVKKSADARNELLQGWKDMGGRMLLLKGLKDAFKALGEIMDPIRKAFKEVFPPVTSKRLIEFTRGFQSLADALHPSEKTVDNLKGIFRGFFSAIKIGIEIFKGVARVAKALFGTFAEKTNILDTASKIGVFITKLRILLVEGGKIKAFFDKIVDAINEPGPYLDKLKQAFIDAFEGIKNILSDPAALFENLKQAVVNFASALGRELSGLPGLNKLGTIELPGAEPLANILDRLSQRFDQLKSAAQTFADVWDAIKRRFEGVKDVFKKIFDYIVTWFQELGQKLANEMQPGDFDAAVDALNVGLLGGIALLLKKFLDGGLKLDFGGGLMAKIAGAVDQLTGVLKAMQAQIKADALLKIAIAIGVLTASLVVLSLIDSAALTKALTAMAVGFGQLVGVMALMNKISSGITGSAGFTALAAGLVLISTAMLIFAAAVKVFATMSWDDIARGMSAITGGLTLMVGAVKVLGQSSLTTIAAALAMIEMATALNILAGAMLIMATLSWEDIGKGMTVIAAGLTMIGLALALVPATAPLVGAGFLLVAVGLTVLAGAMKIFATMEWKDIAKGLVAIGASLLLIGAAMSLMPVSMPITAAGLILVGGALVIIAKALKMFGEMKGGDIAKGLAAMAGALLILAVATTAMIAALPGAVALGIVSVALLGLAEVVKEFAALKFADLIKGLIGMGLVFTLLAGAAILMAPIVPVLIALGAALVLVGAGFALFGVGALAVAKAIEILAKVGKAGAETIFAFFDGLLERLPKLAVAVAKSILEMATVLLEGSIPLVKALGVLLGHIIEKLAELVPKLGVLIAKLIDELAKLIIEKSPIIIEAAITLILNLMKGIRDHIREFVNIAGEIIVNFIKGLQDKLPDIIAAGVDLLITYVQAIGKNVGRLVDAGVQVVINFLKGLAKNINKIQDAGGDLVVAYIKGISDQIQKIIDAAGDLVADFLEGIGRNINKVVTAGADLIINIVKGIADNMFRITDAASTIFIRFLAGLSFDMTKIIAFGALLITKIIQGIQKNLSKIVDAAGTAVAKFIDGIGRNMNKVISKGADVLVKFLEGIGKNTRRIVNAAGELILDILDAIGDAIDKYAPKIRAAGIRIGVEILDGMTFGLGSKATSFFGMIQGVVTEGIDKAREAADSHSPSKKMFKLGEDMILGLTNAFDKDTTINKSAENMTQNVIAAFQKTLASIPDTVSGMENFNPTITPVLDLSSLQKDSKEISSFFAGPNLVPVIEQAKQISSLNIQNLEANATGSTPVQETKEINFNQTINAPEQLSTADIYRQTRNQLVMAKEELNIP